MRRYPVLSGVDRLHTVDDLLRDRRVGLMTNPTGVDHQLNSTIDLVHQRYRLTALFAVEHGIRGDAQAGAKVETTVDPATGVTVYSAYGANDRFTQEMLDAFDVLVFDMQDVGARFYTYLYSLSYAMEACARGARKSWCWTGSIPWAASSAPAPSWTCASPPLWGTMSCPRSTP